MSTSGAATLGSIRRVLRVGGIPCTGDPRQCGVMVVESGLRATVEPIVSVEDPMGEMKPEDVAAMLAWATVVLRRAGYKAHNHGWKITVMERRTIAA
jgi:hypothetical protein